MKICLIAPSPPPYGGIANWQRLVTEYAQAHTDVDFVQINTAVKRRSTDGRSLFDRVVGSGVRMFRQNRRLKRVIREEHPSAIHMTTSGSLALVRDLLLLKTAKRRKVPTVYHLRFGRIPEIAGKNTWEWRLMRRTLGLASEVIAIDPLTRDAIQTRLPEVAISLLPNPVDFAALPERNRQEQQTVLFMGWVVPTKGTEELIEAWNRVGASHPEQTLVLVGPGEPAYLKSLREKCRVPNLRITGEMEHDDAMRIMAEAGIFVLPSHTEGFPNVVAEAMALGRPVIASNVGAIGWMLEPDCGVLVPAGDADALAQALEALLSDPARRRTLGDNARRKAEQEYGIETVFSRYQALWRRLSQDEDKKKVCRT